MKIYWACPLVEHPRVNFWAPKIVQVADSQGLVFPLKWSTTDSVRAVKWAVGVAEVTDVQLAAIEADSQIHVIREIDFLNQFGSLAGPQRTRIRTFLQNAGIALPLSAEVLRDLFSRVTGVADNKTIDMLLAELMN